MLPYMSFWPQPNHGELLANGLPSGTALSYNNPKQSIREDFGTLRADYVARSDTFSAAYTIDDGNSLIPLADPLFGSYTTLRMQVASLEDAHVISPSILNTFRSGFSRAGFNLDSSPLASFPPSLSFAGIGAGEGSSSEGDAHDYRFGRYNLRRPEQRRGRWNRRNLFTYTDSLQINRGIHQISAGVWFQRSRTMKTPLRANWGKPASWACPRFSEGSVNTFRGAGS